MKHLKTIGLALMAAMALMAFTGAGTASATELYKLTAPSPNDTLGVGTEIQWSLKPATSVSWKHTYEKELAGNLVTCTSSSTKFKLEKAGGGEGVHPAGKITSLSIFPCTHTLHVLKAGQLEIQHIPGTTNGTVISKEAETTIHSTVFGMSFILKTGAGTKTGTLTGATSSAGQATFHADANLPNGVFGTVDLTGTYTVTSPTGLVVEAS